MEGSRITSDTVRSLAKMAGLEIPDDRLEIITVRLQAIVEEMDQLDDEAMADVEPAFIFAVPEEGPSG